MAALNFPNNPTVNDEVELGGKTYKWDGVKWLMIKVVSPSEQALAPTITEVSATATSITFTITNNDASTAVILYEVDDATPDENGIELATGVTSGNLTITGLTGDTEYTVSATASVTGKVLSNVTSLAIETLNPFTIATGGTTLEYDSGGKRYKSHTFTSNGTFTITNVGESADDRNQVDYLIIAGGGGGAAGYGAVGCGGGGAGGYRTTNGTSGANSSAESKVTITQTSYGVFVGAGGAGGSDIASVNGSNSYVEFPATITSTGGGRGGGRQNDAGDVRYAAATGGSGGGAYHADPNGASGTSNQGTSGGGSVSIAGDNRAGGGGGGASQAGANGTSGPNGGNGGNGLANTLRDGTSETRAGGGGGGTSGTGTAGTGGAGGGGNGQVPENNGQNATANTGSGGGAAGSEDSTAKVGGNGAGGIVVIRYEIAPSA